MKESGIVLDWNVCPSPIANLQTQQQKGERRKEKNEKTSVMMMRIDLRLETP
jgi:hypothetical protein